MSKEIFYVTGNDGKFFVHHGIGVDGILKLVEDNPRAYVLLYMVHVDGPDSYRVIEGRCDGVVVSPGDRKAHPRLPYHEMFLPDGSDKTYGQLYGTPEMDEFSYRIQAFKKFMEWCRHG